MSNRFLKMSALLSAVVVGLALLPACGGGCCKRRCVEKERIVRKSEPCADGSCRRDVVIEEHDVEEYR